MGFPGT
jgi:Asp/Glu/hydantoin racemase